MFFAALILGLKLITASQASPEGEALVLALFTEPELVRLQPRVWNTSWAPKTIPESDRLNVTYFGSKVGSGSGAAHVGLAIWKVNEEKPILLWKQVLKYEELAPHTTGWIDFNQDGKLDLYMMGGYEEVQWTYAFINRTKDDKFATDNFVSAYDNRAYYSPIVDLDHNGEVEMVYNDPSRPPPYGEDDPNPCSDLKVPYNIQVRFSSEAGRVLMGSQMVQYADSFDFAISQPLSLFSRERVYSALKGESKLSDHTRHFKSHAKWRLSLLKDLIKTPIQLQWFSHTPGLAPRKTECMNEIKDLIHYWQSQLSS